MHMPYGHAKNPRNSRESSLDSRGNVSAGADPFLYNRGADANHGTLAGPGADPLRNQRSAMSARSCAESNDYFLREMTTNSKRALICGSVAFDTIMVFQDRFKNHILPDKIHMLNVSFLVPQMRREFGGCAGNIAFNLKLLGDVGLPMATVGKDFGLYADWMARNGVPLDHVKVIDSEHTAQGFVTTDLDDNQIWAFHPGAMQLSHHNSVADAKDVAIGIVAPDGRDGMIQHAAQFAAAGIAYESNVQVKLSGSGPMAAMMARMGGASFTTVVDSVDTGALADDLFTPPADYKLQAK